MGPKITTTKAQEIIYNLIMKTIEHNQSFSIIPSIFLWGPPGVGKSQTVHHICDKLSEHYEVNLLDLRLYEYTPVDFKGVPYASEDKKFTIWLKPKMFDLDPNKINVIFLDELLQAKPMVQAVALQLVLERRLDDYVLPDKTIIIGASNRKEDGCFIQPMSKALANRFMHFEVVSDAESFIEYAYSINMDHRIISFIQSWPSNLQGNPNEHTNAFPSSRNYEKLSNILALYDSIDECKEIIKGLLGEKIGERFIQHCNAYKIQSFIEIISGKGIVPEQFSMLMQTMDSINQELKTYKLNTKEYTHLLTYLMNCPKEAVVKFYDENRDLIKKYHRLNVTKQFIGWYK